MTVPAPVTWSVDAIDVVLGLLRAGMPGVTVRGSAPDDIPQVVPLVVVRRTGGSSFAPQFWDQPYINVQCWAKSAPGVDAVRAAARLADDARRVLWEAWTEQVTTPAGHIVWLRESQGPLEEPDGDLPHHGRYMATYELRVRRPR